MKTYLIYSILGCIQVLFMSTARASSTNFPGHSAIAAVKESPAFGHPFPANAGRTNKAGLVLVKK